MKKSPALFFFLFSLLTIVLHVQSSPDPYNFDVNITTNSSSSSSSSSLPYITIGSSIFASSSNQTTSYWLSPSGVFAFGFYPLRLNCNEYNVAIWINKQSENVVVWCNNNETIYDGSTIQFSEDGVFIIQLSADDFTTEPLFTQTLGSATYAVMEDTGNLLSTTLILMSCGKALITRPIQFFQVRHCSPVRALVVPNIDDRYQLKMQNYGNLELIDNYKSMRSRWRISWQSRTHKDGGGIVLNLDSTGHMYLVDQDGTVIKKLTKDKKQKENIGGLETTMYRATLEADGVFRLYEERIGQPTHDDHSVNSVVLWASYCKKCEVLAAIRTVFTPLSPFLRVL